MKIMQVNNIYYPLGGSERYFLDLCQALEELGHKVVVVSSLTSSHLHFSHRKEYFLPSARTLGRTDKAWKQWKTLIQKEKPDLIYVHNTYHFLSPFILYKMCQLRPVIRFIHDTRFVCPCSGEKIIHKYNKICKYPVGLSCLVYECGLYKSYNKKTTLPQFIYNLFVTLYSLKLSQKLDCLVVGSNYMYEEVVRNNVPPVKVKINPLYVMMSYEEKKVSFKDKKILFVGRLEKHKGIFSFLKALMLLPSNITWKAQIIGEGNCFKDVKKKVQELGLESKIEFLGHVAYEDLSKYYQQATLVVIPSLIPESFCLVGIEAMAFGKPVVAFDVGGVREWLEHGKNGFLVKRGDIKGLAYYIKYLLENKNLAQRLGEEGKRICKERFSRKRHIEKLINIYKDVLNARQKTCHKKRYFFGWK